MEENVIQWVSSSLDIPSSSLSAESRFQADLGLRGGDATDLIDEVAELAGRPDLCGGFDCRFEHEESLNVIGRIFLWLAGWRPPKEGYQDLSMAELAVELSLPKTSSGP